MDTENLIAKVRAAHTRESLLIGGLTEDQVRDESALPGWTRGHVLGARLAFIRAARRQIELASGGGQAEFYDGGRAGRDATIEAEAARPAADLIGDLLRELKALDAAWPPADGAEWNRTVTYRGPGTLSDILLACWRESEIHRVDLRLGARACDWSAEFCALLLDFLAPRVPEGMRIDLTATDGQVRMLGTGDRVVTVRGSLTDLTAWVAGREPDGELRSSPGGLPPLRRLREARDGGQPSWA
jgi:maleylpyruvate isomerase